MRDMVKMNIKNVELTDTQNLLTLYEQLGYVTTENALYRRLAKILRHPDSHMLVAMIENKPVGIVGFSEILDFFSDEAFIKIGMLVVDEHFRGNGIGKKLIESVEFWAKTQNISAIMLNSGNRVERKAAHEFYKSMGFIVKSTSFYKEIGACEWAI